MAQDTLTPAPAPSPPPALSPAEEARRREQFHAALQAQGLVREFHAPRPDAGQERALIDAQGQPVSETIIAERREDGVTT